MATILSAITELPRDDSQADELWCGQYTLEHGGHITQSYWFAIPDAVFINGTAHDWYSFRVEEAVRIAILTEHGIIHRSTDQAIGTTPTVD